MKNTLRFASSLALLLTFACAQANAQRNISLVGLEGTWSDSFDGYTATNGTVNAIISYNGGTVFAGAFSRAGGLEANGIAFFDGTNWSTFDGGMVHDLFDPVVMDLASFDGSLIASGRFTEAGGVPAANVAKWDGSSWSPLGSGFPLSGFPVLALEVHESQLCAAGSFTVAGGVAANRVACWDGTTWMPLGDGINNTVQTLKSDGATLFAGGQFTLAGSATVNNVAQWNGSEWSSVGDPFDAPNRNVASLALHGGNLIAGTSGGSNAPDANQIMSFDGAAWTEISAGFSSDEFSRPNVSALYAGADGLVASGEQVIDNITTYAVKKYNSTTVRWEPLGERPDGAVRAFAEVGSDLIAGGGFTRFADNTRSQSVARFVNDNWASYGESLDNTVNGPVWSINADGDTVLVAGDFSRAGGQVSENLAWLDGSTFIPFVPGTNGPIYATLRYKGDLCVGGEFTKAGGVDANNVACYDGFNWAPLSGGVADLNGGVASVRAMVEYEGGLYLGGTFDLIDGVQATSNVARWDGSTLSEVGSNVGPVSSLAVQGNWLLAGGASLAFGPNVVTGVRAWDQTSWIGLPISGTTVGLDVNDMAVDGDDIYLAGQGAFDDADGFRTCLLARYHRPTQSLHNVVGCLLPGPLAAIDLFPRSVFPPTSNSPGSGDGLRTSVLTFAGKVDEIQAQPSQALGAITYASDSEATVFQLPPGSLSGPIVKDKLWYAGGVIVSGSEAPYIARFEPSGSVESDPIVATLDTPESPQVGDKFDVVITVTNTDATTAAPDVVAIFNTGLPFFFFESLSRPTFCAEPGDFEINCDLGTLAPGETREFSLGLVVKNSFDTTTFEIRAESSDGRRAEDFKILETDPAALEVLIVTPEKIGSEVNSIDVYVDGIRVADDLGPGEASNPTVTPIGSITTAVDIVDGQDQDNTNPLTTGEVSFAGEGTETSILSTRSALVIAPNGAETLGFFVVNDQRDESTDPERVDIRFANAVLGGGSINIRGPGDQLVVTDLVSGQSTAYDSYAAELTRFEIETLDGSAVLGGGDFDLGNQPPDAWTFVVFGSGSSSGKQASDSLSIVGFDSDGNFLYSVPVSVDAGDSSLPTTLSLERNYPNPFSISTTIRYGIPVDSHVRIVVYDVLGRQVSTLVDRQLPAGYHQVIWGGRDAVGLTASSGVYVLRIEASGESRSGSVVLSR